MDFGFSEEQEMLRKSARDFLLQECPPSLVREMARDEKGYPPQLWDKMAALGWMGLVVPEQYGGEGCNLLDLTVLLEEMGRASVPGPYFAQLVSSLVILEAANESQKKELLTQMSAGKLITTFAISESGISYKASSIKTEAVRTTEGYVISGTKIFVPAAHVAQRLIVIARVSGNGSRGLTLFIIDPKTAGVDLNLLETLSGEKQYKVSLNNVKASPDRILGRIGKGWKYLTPALKRAAIAKCAEMLGASQYILEMTVEYAKQRVQFGQPIGSFQAVQHHCANMSVDVDSSRLLTYQAAWMLDQGLPCDKQVAMAKAWVSEAYRRVDILGHQIHGGVGVIEDHDLPLYTKRSLGDAAIFGDADYHYDLVAQEL